MLPLKDAIDRPRHPLAWVLAGTVLAVGVVRPIVAVLAALVVLVTADAIAHRSRPGVAIAAAIVGGALTVLFAYDLGDSTPPHAWNPLGPLAAVGAAAALAGVSVGIAPTSRVLTLSLLPGAGGMLAVPAAVWTLVGIALIVVGQATNAILPPGTGLTTLLTLAVLGLALVVGTPLGWRARHRH